MRFFASIAIEIEAEDDEAAENTLDLAVQGADVYGVVDVFIAQYPEEHEPEEG